MLVLRQKFLANILFAGFGKMMVYLHALVTTLYIEKVVALPSLPSLLPLQVLCQSITQHAIHKIANNNNIKFEITFLSLSLLCFKVCTIHIFPSKLEFDTISCLVTKLSALEKTCSGLHNDGLVGEAWLHD